MSDVIDHLLECHVEYELSMLQGEAFDELVEEWIEAAFQWLAAVKLNDLVTREQIVGVIERYVIELKVSGGITELAGEMANVVFSSRSSARTRVADVCSPDDYEEFADKIVGMTGVHRELIRYLTRSSAFGTLASRFLALAITDFLFGSDGGKAGPRRGVGALGQRLVPGIERRVAAALGRYFAQHSKRLAKETEKHLIEVLDPEWVRQTADDVYDAVSELRLSEIAGTFTPQDLEDFVVLGYEFWLKFRQTPYFHDVVVDVVDRLFTKYGEESLASVIEDMGITQAMVTREVKTFARPILEHALRTGFAAERIRAHLEPFYRSPALAAILAP